MGTQVEWNANGVDDNRGGGEGYNNWVGNRRCGLSVRYE